MVYIPTVGKNQPRNGLTGEVEMRRGELIRDRIGVGSGYRVTRYIFIWNVSAIMTVYFL